MDIVDFSAGMDPAGCFCYIARAVQLVELGVSISMQHTA